MTHHIDATLRDLAVSGAKVTTLGVLGTLGSLSLSEWGVLVGIAAGVATILYTLTNWAFLVRSWWVKEKAHREGKKRPSGFVPLDPPKE